MVRVGSFVLLCLVLNACAEYNSSEEAIIEVDSIERQKLYLAQERAQLDAYIITHELEGIQRNGFGMFELSMIKGKGNGGAEVGKIADSQCLSWEIKKDPPEFVFIFDIKYSNSND